MRRVTRIVVGVVVLCLLTVAFLFRKETAASPAGAHVDAATGEPVPGRPRFLELGSSTCVPCKMMKDVMATLEQAYGDQLTVEFIDVTVTPEAGYTYGMRIMPTQILFDAAGEEIFRHEGFFAAEDIVAAFRENGVPLAPLTSAAAPQGWMDSLFVSLTGAVEGSWGVALLAALVWGILSVLLSPCHLASIPLIVGFIDEQGRISTKRAFFISSLFSLGILLTIAALGVVSAVAGQMLGDVGPWGTMLVAVVFVAVGLHLLGVLPAPWQAPGQVGMKRKGALAAFILGLIFGIALGPCTFAYMAPMLAVAFRIGGENVTYSIALLLLYGIGHCGVIVLAGTCTEVVQRYMNWNERSRGALILKQVCGLLVIAGGLYLVWAS